MSLFSILCCDSLCQSERPRQKLPPYTIPCQRRRMGHDSYKRQQEIQFRIDALAKDKGKSPRKGLPAGINEGQSKVLQMINSRLWNQTLEAKGAVHKSSSRSLFWCFKNNGEKDDAIDTDLDSAFKDYKCQTTKKNEVIVMQPKKTAQEYTPVRVSMEGQLLKFTNLVKGYQYRWFVLNAESGMLEYFEKRDHKKLKTRGAIYLQAAKISIAGDKQTFLVSAANGKIFKLKACDAKERQIWVERLRATADYHTGKLALPQSCTTQSMMNVMSIFEKDHPKMMHNVGVNLEKDDAFLKAKHYCREAEDFCRHLDSIILEVPFSAAYMKSVDPSRNIVNDYLESVDKDLLMLKATSGTILQCVNDCISILQLARVQLAQTTSPGTSITTKPSELPFITHFVVVPSNESLPNPEDEVPDQRVIETKSTDKMEDHKSVILHLLSQLKLGMDLTKVVLPTFILERRSLLELFTDCMAHPDIFVNIPKITDPEGRFLAVFEWYLTSFHNGRLGTSAKKPYNPILGETFHCSWYIPNPAATSKDIHLVYIAEQVSHHPPVSAFYLECLQNHIKMNASIHTKSKFLGMSVGVSLLGKVRLRYEDHAEDYVFTLPSAYCRSILTVPWVELGDKVQLTCEKTGYNANITFHTKPFYGGKLHVVTAEAKNTKTGEIICKVTGEWNSMFEFTYPVTVSKDKKTKISKVLDVHSLKIYDKYVRPLEKQSDYESRKLWVNVTNALTAHDIQKATEYKHELENIQRKEEERERLLKLEHEAKFFRKVDGVWLFKSLPDNFVKETKK